MIILDLLKGGFQGTEGSEILFLIAAFAGSFVICLVVIPVIIKLSIRYNLVDKPNERKVHKVPISRLGGLGIVAGTTGITTNDNKVKIFI